MRTAFLPPPGAPSPATTSCPAGGAGLLLVSRPETLVPVARRVALLLRPHWTIDYDDAGCICRRSRRPDEIGTPYAVTVDFGSLEDSAVPVRDRDSMAQDRIPIPD